MALATAGIATSTTAEYLEERNAIEYGLWVPSPELLTTAQRILSDAGLPAALAPAHTTQPESHYRPMNDYPDATFLQAEGPTANPATMRTSIDLSIAHLEQLCRQMEDVSLFAACQVGEAITSMRRAAIALEGN